MWDLGNMAQVPLPKKGQNYSSHITQFVAFFFSDGRKNKLERQMYVPHLNELPWVRL
jgi:cytochrome c peroxidase